MIHITIDPFLAQWGMKSISWHGLCLAAGVLMTYLIFLREGTRQGFEKHSLTELSFWVLFCGLICARFVSLSGNWRAYLANPSEILALNQGGITITGGILGATFATLVYTKWKRLSFGKLADVLAIAAPLGYIVGHSGCVIAGDTWGLPTDGRST